MQIQKINNQPNFGMNLELSFESALSPRVAAEEIDLLRHYAKGIGKKNDTITFVIGELTKYDKWGSHDARPSDEKYKISPYVISNRGNISELGEITEDAELGSCKRPLILIKRFLDEFKKSLPQKQPKTKNV